MLHVTNGDSVVGTLDGTSLGGSALAWQDVLHAGPVPDVPREQLLEIRAGFLRDAGWGTSAAILSSLQRRDDRFLSALAAGDGVVLWFEHDLYDQLQLLDVLSLAARLDVAAAHLELIVVDAFLGRPAFRGLGELSSSELESLWPLRAPATPELLTTARETWTAIRASDPVALAAAAADGVPGLPLAAPALRRLLEELPALGDGLSRTERQVLQALADGPRDALELFALSQDSEEAPFFGDTWFFRVLGELGAGPGPLLETVERDSFPPAPPFDVSSRVLRTKLMPTAAGRAVLAGEADRIDVVGIDRWILGTHVTPAAAWRWDADAGTVVAPG